MTRGDLLAVSDLHVEHDENRRLVEAMKPNSDEDWLLIAGDVANSPERLQWTLELLASRFSKVIWVPGNHELHCYPDDSASLRGENRYRHLIDLCRSLGVVTPEDPYEIWEGALGPVRIVPLFLLYDYSFGFDIAPTTEEALQRAWSAGVVCDDEYLLHPDPHRSRGEWCAARLEATTLRLERDTPLPSVLLNHFPLRIEPTRSLIRREFAQWCGTARTADWHRRFRAAAVVYGHLHINRTMWHDGVPFHEVSMGYPRERRFRSEGFRLCRVLQS